MKKSFLMTLFAILCITSVNAQSLTKGSLNGLKGQKRMHVVIDYTDVQINKHSEQFTKEMYGTEWAEKWDKAKEITFLPNFLSHLNKNANAKREVMLFGDYPDAEYQLTYRVLAFSRNWDVAGEVVITEKGSSIPIAIISNADGPSRRIGGIHAGTNTNQAGSAFSFAGQYLGKFMSRKLR
jgi:hypothetical protein